MGSAPLWTSVDLWPQSSSSYVLALLPIIILRPRIPPHPRPLSSPSSLSLSFVLAAVILHILLDVLLSVLFVTSLLVWWLWGSIHGHGVHSFPRGLVVQYRVVVVVVLWEFVIVPVVLSWSWLGCCCCGWVVVVVVGLSWRWLHRHHHGCAVVMVSWPSLCMHWAWLLIIPPVWRFLAVVSSMAEALLSLFATPALSCPHRDDFPMPSPSCHMIRTALVGCGSVIVVVAKWVLCENNGH